MKVLCYSVRLQSLTAISDKCLLATGFDGSEALIPKSQYYGQDYDVTKSEAHWISAWILDKKDLQYSGKKEAWFDKESGKRLPNITFTKHIPDKVTKKTKPDADLIR
jgi:hypothetical protein